MDKRKKRENGISAILVIAIATIGFASMFVGQGREILQNMGLIAKEENTYISTSVDWSKVYPFKEENAAPQYNITDYSSTETQQPAEKRTVFVRFRNLITKMKDFESDCEDNILGYTKLLELSGRINRIAGKTDFGESNGVAQMENGHLNTTSKWNGYNIPNIELQAEKTGDFADWLAERDIDFFYVQKATKTDKYDSNKENLEINYVNNYFDFYSGTIKNQGIDVLDMRDYINEMGIDHYSLFFKTDEHWTMEAGMLAAEAIAEKMNTYGYNLDTTILNPNLYTENTYEKWFLGALGRRVTLGYTEPDDFTVYSPKFATDFSVVALDKDLDVRGGFDEVLFNHAVIDTCDYYGFSMYEGLSWGNRPLFQVTNNNVDNGVKVLLIRDSFSLATIPYLSLLVQQCDCIDVRTTNGNFNGSIKTYIEQTQPDVVILMYDILDYDYN